MIEWGIEWIYSYVEAVYKHIQKTKAEIEEEDQLLLRTRVILQDS